MVERNDNKITRTSGLNTWRAGCSESCTSGSEGGPEKPIHRKMDRALRSDPYTYVPTRSGMAYVCFIVDAFSRRIVGWRVATHMRTEMVLDALEMARTSRGGRRLVGLVTHADAGSQFTSVRFTERLDEIGARPSIGTVADSFDNALAETTNGLYKTECVYGPDTNGWDDVDQLELATLSWVHWFNEHRLHSHCRDVPPAEFEAAFYAAQQPDPAGVGNQ
jgi:putative transposase